MAEKTDPDAHKRQIIIWYLVAAVIGVLLVQAYWASYSQIETIPYSQFETLLDQGKIDSVTVSGDSIQGTLKEPLPDGQRDFFVIRVDAQLAEKLESHQVVVNGTASAGLLQTVLSWVVPIVIFYAIWFFLFRRIAEKQGSAAS